MSFLDLNSCWFINSFKYSNLHLSLAATLTKCLCVKLCTKIFCTLSHSILSIHY